jgi:hypothetical protein
MKRVEETSSDAMASVPAGLHRIAATHIGVHRISRLGRLRRAVEMACAQQRVRRGIPTLRDSLGMFLCCTYCLSRSLARWVKDGE